MFGESIVFLAFIECMHRNWFWHRRLDLFYRSMDHIIQDINDLFSTAAPGIFIFGLLMIECNAVVVLSSTGHGWRMYISTSSAWKAGFLSTSLIRSLITRSVRLQNCFTTRDNTSNFASNGGNKIKQITNNNPSCVTSGMILDMISNMISAYTRSAMTSDTKF